MRKKDIIDKFIEVLLIIFFVTFYCYNSVTVLGNSLYFFPLIIMFILSLMKVIKNKINKESFNYIAWYLSFFLFSVLSLLWSININYSLVVIKRIIQGFFLIFTLSTYINSSQRIKKVILINGFALLLMTFLLIIKESGKTYFYGDVIGFYRNSIGLSMAFGISLMFYLFIKERKKSYILFLIPFFYVLYKSGARKAMILSVLLIIISLLFLQGRNVKKIFKSTFIIIILILGCIFLLKNNELLKTRMVNLFQSFTQDVTADASIVERKYYREVAFSIFKENPIIGIGIFGFAAHLNNIGYSHVAYCHCNWLELLSTLGIIGFLIYYSNYYRIAYDALKNFDKENVSCVIPVVLVFLLFLMEYGMVSYYELYVQLTLMIMHKILVFDYDNEKKSKITVEGI